MDAGIEAVSVPGSAELGARSARAGRIRAVKEVWPSLDDDKTVVVDTWELQGDPITFPFTHVVSVG